MHLGRASSIQAWGKKETATPAGCRVLSLTLFIFTVHGDNKKQTQKIFVVLTIVFKLLFKIILS